MYEYTWCPCACGGIVRIWGSAGIKPCCKPCWQTFWESTVSHLEGGDGLTEDYGHSEQCLMRQAARQDVEVVTGREFYLMGSDPVETLRVAEEDQD